jgi:hypothetical protein
LDLDLNARSQRGQPICPAVEMGLAVMPTPGQIEQVLVLVWFWVILGSLSGLMGLCWFSPGLPVEGDSDPVAELAAISCRLLPAGSLSNGAPDLHGIFEEIPSHRVTVVPITFSPGAAVTVLVTCSNVHHHHFSSQSLLQSSL